MKLMPCPECGPQAKFENANCSSCGVSETMMAWYDAADKYLSQGQHENAERFYKKALELLKDRHGSYHPQIAMSLYGLARVSSIRGQHAQAELFYKQAVDVIEKVLPDHPKAGKIISGLGEHYLQQKQYANAEELFRRALAIQEKALGRSHPEAKSVRGKLSAVCKETKRAGKTKKSARDDSRK